MLYKCVVLASVPKVKTTIHRETSNEMQWDHFISLALLKGYQTASENYFFVLGKVRKGPLEIYYYGQDSLL
jgi:hypothetical protein